MRLRSILRALGFGWPRTALDLGCGAGDAARICHALWPAASIIALDIDARALRHLRPGARLWPLQADLRALPLAGRFDLVIARHPDVHRYSIAWHAGLWAATGLLGAGGILLVTAYEPDEIARVRGWLAQHPDLYAFDPPAEAIGPPDLVGHDRFYMAYRRLST
jgi:SAM-dependent methyltransferase